MSVPLQIFFAGFTPTPSIRDSIDHQVERLGRKAKGLSSVRVVMDTPHRRGGRNAEYRVRVEPNVPQRKPIVARSSRGRDLYTCIVEAFECAERLLLDALSKRRARHPSLVRPAQAA